MDDCLNSLDWDNKNAFNEGVGAFEFTLLNPLPVPTSVIFFNGNDLAGDLLDKPYNNADTYLVGTQSSCTNTSVANVTRTRDIHVRQMQYKVNAVGSGLTVQNQFDQKFEWVRGAIDGKLKRKGDIQPGFQRRNWMYQEDFIIIPGPFTIDGNTAMVVELVANAEVNFLFEVDSIGVQK